MHERYSGEEELLMRMSHGNKAVILIVAAILIPHAFASPETASKSCWYSDSDGFSEHADCLELQGKELLMIKRWHLNRLEFVGDLATVFNGERGWMYVNRKGEVIISGVAALDNGPDEFREGFVRYERNGKCGYATSGNPRAILPLFDGCMQFENGKARVCNGCREEPVDPDGEYHELKGGEWFCIDKSGKRVACRP
jgi:hypothetical protein